VRGEIPQPHQGTFKQKPMKFFLAPLVFILGILCMKYSVQITDQFSGKIDFAEKIFGTGMGAGTYTWWKLFGLAMCILSVLWLFGMLPTGSV
jgi:hypothetical protein